MSDIGNLCRLLASREVNFVDRDGEWHNAFVIGADEGGFTAVSERLNEFEVRIEDIDTIVLYDNSEPLVYMKTSAQKS